MAGVALGDIHLRFAWQAWPLVTTCDIHLRFAWQAWPLATRTFVLSHTIFDTPSFTPLCHTPSLTHRHRPSFTHNFVTRQLSPSFTHHLCHTLSFTHNFVTHHLCHTPSLTSFCVASVALGDIHLRFAWQAWHLVTSTFVSRGRCGTYGTGLALVAQLCHNFARTHLLRNVLSNY